MLFTVPVFRIRLASLQPARALFRDCLAWAGNDHETLWVAHLDQQGFCIHLDDFPGELTKVDFPTRQIHARIAECETAGLILAHNHPSGDPRPSTSDIRVTKHMAIVAEHMDCQVFDHIIVTDGIAYTSFRELGLL